MAGNGELSADGVLWGTTPIQVDLGVSKMRYLINSSPSLNTEVTEDVTINSIISTGSVTTTAFGPGEGSGGTVGISIGIGISI